MIWPTLGGVTFGLAFLVHYLIKTLPTLKAARKDPFGTAFSLVPFVYGGAYGTLGTLAVGGLLGWAFDTALWITNWLGDVALYLGVGTSAGISSRGNYLPLTTYGSAAFFLLTVVTMALIKFRKCGWDVKIGTLCGMSLGASGGVAGLVAVPLAQGCNWLGEFVYVYWQTKGAA